MGDNNHPLDNHSKTPFTLLRAPIVNFNTYPNPTENEMVSIDYYVPTESLVQINVFNLEGKRLDEISLVTAKGFESYNINLQELQNGFYVIEIKTNSKSVKRKVLKLG